MTGWLMRAAWLSEPLRCGANKSPGRLGKRARGRPRRVAERLSAAVCFELLTDGRLISDHLQLLIGHFLNQ
jgi:hypothetical protein